ncbi:hypothetical protein PybrP1_013106 [[Pythium] brassicae (nom. inval.)]|nr:hypothetical protein PybrP1_013106 [[Pythium] brassicae (nom. inval.)]
MSFTLSLPTPPASFTKESAVAHGPGGYFKTKAFEAFGRTYHRRVKNVVRGRSASCESLDDDEKERKASKKQEEAILKKYRKSIRGKTFTDLTMYQQLGLSEFGFAVTEEQVKKAYHRVLIEHHPDKTGKTEKDPNYLAVQKAFATLVDPAKKRAYDSQCDFDDWIPTGTEKIKENDGAGKSFYDLYGPVFAANARFSETTPVPALGDDATDMAAVTAFYDFWHKFDSWRIFLHDSEHDVESAEHRDHKRWMAKKNEAAAKKKKKAEYTRLANLVDRAQAADPRIRRVKQAAKDEKERVKREKEEAAQRALDAERRAAEEAERAARAKDEQEKELRKNSKLAKEKQKKLFRKVKKAFRELMTAAEQQGAAGAIDVVKTEELCEALEMDELQALVDACGGAPESLQPAGLAQVAAALAKL